MHTLLGEVQLLTLCQSLFQFLLNLGLCFAQHIFEYLLAGSRVMTCCVPSLPATILALADIALAVASSFRHLRSLLISDTHYHRKGKIAIHEIYQRFCSIFDLSRCLFVPFILLAAAGRYNGIEEKWKTDLELKDIILEIADDLISGCEADGYETDVDHKWKAKYIHMHQYQNPGPSEK